MKKNEETAHRLSHQPNYREQNDPEGYPLYPEEEDIYNKLKKDRKLNPDDANIIIPEKPGKRNEKDFDEDMTGDDLDIPGAEFDDEEEIIGSEDEENNYYSLGGDDHADLEENAGQ